MAVSKRLRYEVLRRDNHACRYCGRSAPKVELEVDHVVPRSLGGSDKPWNLVTACRDCNSGKSAIEPERPLIEGPSEESIRTARHAREVIGYLWGALPLNVESEQVRSELANRFTDDHLDGDEWIDTVAWSRELMAFAQAVLDTVAMADHRRTAVASILRTLAPSARTRWMTEAKETFTVQGYADAPEQQMQEYAVRQAFRYYGAAAGDVAERSF